MEILKSLSEYEITKLCDCLNVEVFKPEERVIKEGQQGDKFYLITKGKAIATKLNVKTLKEDMLKDYEEKMYFGELALLKNQPRKANIIAKTDLETVTIDRNAFKRILGPLQEILQRNAQQYK